MRQHLYPCTALDQKSVVCILVYCSTHSCLLKFLNPLLAISLYPPHSAYKMRLSTLGHPKCPLSPAIVFHLCCSGWIPHSMFHFSLALATPHPPDGIRIEFPWSSPFHSLTFASNTFSNISSTFKVSIFLFPCLSAFWRDHCLHNCLVC